MNQWDNIYKHEGTNYKYYNINTPHPDIYRVIDFLKKKNIHSILDLGCGTGRNSIPFLDRGYQVDGIDLSEEAINIFKNQIHRKSLNCKLHIGNIYEKLPFNSNSFDVVISVQSIQHSFLDRIKFAISEIERVVKDDGFIFVTVCGRISKGKVRECLVRTAKEIAPRTYIPTKGSEEGLPHYIYNKHELLKQFKKFKVLDLWKDDKDYYCLLGQKK